MARTWIWRALAAALLSLGLVGAAVAQADTLPVVKLVTGTPISPSSADSYYGTATTHTTGLCNLNSIMCGIPRAIPIHELARSLSQGGTLSPAQFTQNVFEYVYKNVDTEFRYGLSKGAFGALLDHSGTPFDQAHLMVELLREGTTISSSYASIAPSYQAGTITLTPAQFQAWTGMTNAQAVCQYLANGAIPEIVNGQAPSNCSGLTGNLTSLTIAHIWVSANGLLYDPSFKTYIQKTSIDLAAAMGCGTASAPTCGSTALATAIPSTSQGYDSVAQANYVQNVQYTALGTTLNGFAQNLQHYLENPVNNLTAADINDVAGGQEIDPASAPTSGGLSYSVNSIQHTWTGDIPDQYRSSLNIQFNLINVTLYADETSGYWLYIGGVNVFSGNVGGNLPRYTTLFLERERNNIYPVDSNVKSETSGGTTNLVAGPGSLSNEIVDLSSSVNNNAPYRYVTLTMNVYHPYATNGGGYMNDTLVKTVDFLDVYSQSFVESNGSSGSLTANTNNGKPFLIVQSWGRTGRGLAERYGRMAAAKDPVVVSGQTPLRLISLSSVDQLVIGQTGLTGLTGIGLPNTIATWLAQSGMATSIVDGLAHTRTQEHHTFGIASEFIANGSLQGQGTDAVTALSVVSAQGATASVLPSFTTTTTAYAALEGSVYEQQQNVPMVISAVRFFQLYNAAGTRFYQGTPSNLSSVLPQLTNYATLPNAGTQLYTAFLTNSTPTFNVVIPQNGSVGPFTTTISSEMFSSQISYPFAPALAYSTDGSMLGYVTAYGYKGAGVGLLSQDPVSNVLRTVDNTKPEKPLSFSVNLDDGGLKMAMAPDLKTGAGSYPEALTYQRFYDSNNTTPPHCVLTAGQNDKATRYKPVCSYDVPGNYNGWTDSLSKYMSLNNDGFRGLGSDSALDASNAIAALYSIYNLSSAQSFNSYLSGIYASAWMTDKLLYNQVTIVRPPDSATFVRLPDGRFNPRPGSAGAIVQVGAPSAVLGALNGSWMETYGYVTFTYTDADGVVSSFSPVETPIPNGVDVSGYTGRQNVFTPNKTFDEQYVANNYFNIEKEVYPSGVKVSYTNPSVYTDDNGTAYSSGAGTLANYINPSAGTRAAVNNLGRSITVASDPNAYSDPDGYVVGNILTDDGGRAMTIRNQSAFPAEGMPAENNGIKIIDLNGNKSFVDIANINMPGYGYDNKDVVVSDIRTADNVSQLYLTFNYDQIYRISLVTNANGHITSYYPGRVSSESSVMGAAADALGNVSVGYFDRFGRETKTVDPLGRVSVNGYDDVGRLTLKATPELTCTAYTYDVRGSELTESRYPSGGCTLADPGNGQLVGLTSAPGTPIVTSTTYNEGASVYLCTYPATCNKRASEADALGHVTAYAWNSITGQLLSVLKPADANGAQAETDLGYTPYTGTDGNSISMLSSKTDWISKSPSKSVTTAYTYNTANKFVLSTATVDTGGLALRTCFKFDTYGNLISTSDPRATTCP